MTMQRLPNVTDEWPSSNHPLSTTLLIHTALSPKDLNECAELLPQCH